MGLFRKFLLSLMWMIGLAATNPIFAALGPENVFLVVNPRSYNSLAVANAYVDLRQIPARNILHLEWPGSVVQTDIATFRQRILMPILSEIDRRGLSGQIDCVAYSAGYPYAIDYTMESGPRAQFPTASITGLTFHYQAVLAKNATAFSSMRSNQYANVTPSGPSIPFHSAQGWKNGRPDANGLRYMMSVMLAYPHGRGNSLAESVRCLTRSRFADGIRPDGTFYFTRNDDIRSRTRLSHIQPAVSALKALGRSAEILDANMPKNKQDVLGALLGKAAVQWGKSRNRMVPGAICENLTSFGCVLDDGPKQVAATDFLRFGASGTSGTVVEPFAIAAKFPTAALYTHYERGRSLVESFYLATSAPYQLLVLGDPLCQPMVDHTGLRLGGVRLNQSVQDEITLAPQSMEGVGIGSKPEKYSLMVDGRLVAVANDGQAFRIKTTKLADGFHNLVILARNQAETVGRLRVPLNVDNQPISIQYGKDLGEAFYAEPLRLVFDQTGLDRVFAIHAGRQVASGDAASGSLLVDTRQLGLGSSRVQIIGIAGDGRRCIGAPARIRVLPPRPIRGHNLVTTLAPGFVLKLSDGRRVVLRDSKPSNWLANAGAKPNQPFEIHAMVQLDSPKLHQLSLLMRGNLDLMVNGRKIRQFRHQQLERSEWPLMLGQGQHLVTVKGSLPDLTGFTIRLGHRGASRLSDRNTYHAATE